MREAQAGEVNIGIMETRKVLTTELNKQATPRTTADPEISRVTAV